MTTHRNPTMLHFPFSAAESLKSLECLVASMSRLVLLSPSWNSQVANGQDRAGSQFYMDLANCQTNKLPWLIAEHLQYMIVSI